MRFAIYSRKSVLTGRGESIENQVELCRSYLAAHYPGVRPEEVAVYEDEGFSGNDFQRPQFRRMLEDIRRARPEALVCYRLDRVSRSVGDFADLIRRLEGWGVAFLCIREKFDTSTPMGKAMMYIASVFAQLERETIAQRVRDNMCLLARTGRWLGGTTPTGFRAGRAGGRRRPPRLPAGPRPRGVGPRRGHLPAVSGPAEPQRPVPRLGGGGHHRPHRAALLPARPAGDSAKPGVLRRGPRRLGLLRRPGGGSLLSPGGLRRPPGPAGLPEAGLHRRALPPQPGGHRPPRDKWIIALGRHPALVSGATWRAVQELLTPDRAPAVHNRRALLSGLLFCARCGEKLLPKARKGGSYDYICRAKLRRGAAACSCPNLSGAAADQAALDALSAQFPRLAPRLEELAREEQRAACRILLQRADWDGADLAFTLCRL